MSHEKVAEILGEKVKVVKYPIRHFDIYKGENFEKAVRGPGNLRTTCL